MKHLKAMEKALKVFHKAKAKLEKTLTELDKDHGQACEAVAKLQNQQRSLSEARAQVSGMHTKISDFLEVK